MAAEIYKKLQEKLGCSIEGTPRVEAALTHSSTGAEFNYERLEFLGDRVLGLVMAQILYEAFPDESEGGMAKRHAALVQGKTLAEIAREIDLGSIMVLSDAERAAGGAGNENILSDGLEALLGALYLDAGLLTCHRVIEKLWGDRVKVMSEAPQDPKTALQEWAQSHGLPLPSYELIGRQGPDHAPVFDVQVTVKGFSSRRAAGSSIRTAEKDAAKLLLEHLRAAT